MENLKIGDRVVLTETLLDEDTSTFDLPKGLKGTVMNPFNEDSYLVEFDGFNGSREIQSCFLEKIS